MKSWNLLLVCVVAASLGAVHSQQTCTLPSEAVINSIISKIANSGGGEGSEDITINIISYHFTCLAVDEMENIYSLVSAPVVYDKNVSGVITRFMEQFQISCTGAGVYRQADSEPVENNPPAAAFTAPTRRDCFTCAVSGSTVIDLVTNCAVCMQCQSLGQGACTEQTDCCPFFERGVCVDNCSVNRTANVASNFTCACNGSFAENSAGMCVDVCEPNPCQNGGICTGVDNAPSCNCPPEFTGATCQTIVVPEPAVTTTSTPSATPVTEPPSPRLCPDNCRQCNSAGCCTQCEDRFELKTGETCPTCVPTVCSDGCTECFNSSCCRVCRPGFQLVVTENSCTCNVVPPMVCSVLNCTTCENNNGRPCCTKCQPGYTAEDCRCLVIQVRDSAAVTAGIAVGVVLFVLLLLALAILAAYLIYAFVTHGTDSKRAKSHAPFGNGDAHDNPLYINPKEFDDEEA